MAEKIIYDIIVDSDGATKAVSALNKETGKLDKSFEDIHGDIKPLTGRLGELQDRMYELAQAGDTASNEFKSLAGEASRLKTVQKDVDKQLDRTSRTLDEKFSTAVTVASGSMVLAEGAMSAMGVSAKTSEESMAKMVQVIAGATAIQQLNEATGIFSSLARWITKTTIYTKAQTIAQRALNLVMSANPVVLLVAGITALIGVGYALITMFGESTSAADKNTAAIKRQTKAIDEQSGANTRKLDTLKKELKQELDILAASGASKKAIRDAERKGAQQLINEASKQRIKAGDDLRDANDELRRLTEDGSDEEIEAQKEKVEKLKGVESGYIVALNGFIQNKIDLAHKYKVEDIKANKARLDKKNQDNADVEVFEDNTVDEIIETVDDDALEDDSEIVALGEKYAQELLIEQMRVDNLIAEEQRLADEKERIQNESLMFAQALSGLFGQLGAQNKALATAGIVLEKGAAIAGVIIEAQKANAQITSAKAAANLLIDAKYAPIPGGFAFATAEKAALSVRAAKNITKNNVMAGISVATIAASSLGSRPTLSGGGGGGQGSGPAAPTFNTVGQSPASANNIADNANSQIESNNNNPVRAYVVSTDISSQQALDRDIEEDNSLG